MATDELSSAEELPIFPLNTVLFPGAVLPLHIFENRYKKMIRYAIDQRGFFGLSYRADAEVGRETLPEIGSVGCVAKIKAVMPLEEGRLHLLSIGVVRYRVVRFTQMLPFLIARVVNFSDNPEPDQQLEEIANALSRMAKQLLGILASSRDLGSAAGDELPEDPEMFSLLLASLAPINNESKQYLLEMTSTKARLADLRTLISDFLVKHRAGLKAQERAKKNGHGRLSGSEAGSL